MAQGRTHGQAMRGSDQVPRLPAPRGFFGRMFHELPTFRVRDQFLKDLAGGMRETEAQQNPAGDNPTLPSGFTYFGQFVDHDLTLDRSSLGETTFDPEQLRNFRTPRFDLDCLYGRGPRNSPELYARGGVKLLIGHNPDVDEDGTALDRDDLPRNQEGIAIIGDPRNDENIIVSQLHLTFIRFHNRLVDVVREQGIFEDADEVFKEAHRLARWHYQWIVVHDFLARLVPEGLIATMLTPTEDPRVRTRFYRPEGQWAFMPVEFSAAAYRFGHSMVRPTYLINSIVPELPIFSLGEDPGPLEAFHGGRRLPDSWTVRWPFFFELDAEGPQLGRKINTKLAEGLFNLPGESGEMELLALRNLRRGVRLGLPSGGRVARAMGVSPLRPEELGFPGPAPLWFYVLKEAELRGEPRGQRLGAVGGRIVAEVFLGILGADPLSFVNVEPDWTPESESIGSTPVKSMAELIRFAAPAQAERG